ncbi:MAG: beta-glucosidase, partial [Clostridia bacterium]|nr:beta-glucosidase [Clostridia bacterium]
DEIAFTGDKGIKLKDVYNKSATLDAFIAQLSDDDLAALCCGEGMNSPKATPGTGGALGGQTKHLSEMGIPVCCVTDGPSGIRRDSGEKATLVPNGTMLACTWDTALAEELYTRIGEELKEHEVDALLGPGINLHRHPLCGRNFEYFSEDPLLTGKFAAAITRGIAKNGAYSTIKHFAANNQETNRYGCESIVSERALRELYLKPFEIAVKEGANILVMTAYNPLNGFWTASHYDLTKTILREEWGFANFVMTDWWAKCNLESKCDGNGEMLQAMVRAENDVYMVCADAQTKSRSVLDGIASGYITRGELQRSVKNILNWIMRSNTFAAYLENGCVPKYPVVRDDSNVNAVAVIDAPASNESYEITLATGATVIELSVLSDTDILAQTPITVYCGDTFVTVSVCGTEGAYVDVKRFVDMEREGAARITAIYPDVIRLKSITVKQ